MLPTCQCKRGFFVLQDCKNEATTQCENCQRYACVDHLAYQTDGKMCVECWAKQGKQTPKTADNNNDSFDTDDSWYRSDWTYSYRHRYYRDYRYSPTYWGRTNDPYYDDYDFRSFDKPQQASLADSSLNAVDNDDLMMDDAGDNWFDS